MNMKKISTKETDLTQRIKNAKPVQDNDSRTNELFLDAMEKSSLKYKTNLLVKFRVALILTPLTLAMVIALSIFAPTQNSELSLDLKNFSEKQVSHLDDANASVTAICAEVNKYCIDTGLLSQIKIDWQLSLADSVTAVAGQGHAVARSQLRLQLLGEALGRNLLGEDLGKVAELEDIHSFQLQSSLVGRI